MGGGKARESRGLGGRRVVSRLVNLCATAASVSGEKNLQGQTKPRDGVNSMNGTDDDYVRAGWVAPLVTDLYHSFVTRSFVYGLAVAFRVPVVTRCGFRVGLFSFFVFRDHAPLNFTRRWGT